MWFPGAEASHSGFDYWEEKTRSTNVYTGPPKSSTSSDLGNTLGVKQDYWYSRAGEKQIRKNKILDDEWEMQIGWQCVFYSRSHRIFPTGHLLVYKAIFYQISIIRTIFVSYHILEK